MKMIPLLLAILLLGQSLRAGVGFSCCQSTAETEIATKRCHSTTMDSDFMIDKSLPKEAFTVDKLPTQENDNCNECHCPGCFIGTTTLVEPPQLIDYSLPNFSNPILYQRQIHSSDYAFPPWQPPQF